MNEDNDIKSLNLGNAIKVLRKSKNMTQVELAEAIDKTESTVRKYEANIIEPPFSVLYKITQVLGIPIRMFISFLEFTDSEDKNIMLDRLKESQNNSIKRDGLENLAQVYFSLGQYGVEQNILKAVYESKSFRNFLIWLYNSESEKQAINYSKVLGIDRPKTPYSEIFDLLSDLDLKDYIAAIAMDIIGEYNNRQENRK